MAASSYPPSGFRFLPNDDELIIILNNKIKLNGPSLIDEIKVVDLYTKDPMTLTEMNSPLGKKEWYFFTRNPKYPNGSRADRTAGNGYWKATGEKKVYHEGKVVGFKKSLGFYVGKHRKRVKTDWIMHEYRVDDQSCHPKADNMKLEEWVLCRIHDNGRKGKGNEYIHAVMDINVSDHGPSNTHQDHDQELLAP